MIAVESRHIGGHRFSRPATIKNFRPRLIEVLLFAVIPLEKLSIAGFPLTELIAVAIVLLALFSHPLQTAVTKWWIPAILMFSVWCLLSTIYVGADLDMRRFGHLGIWCLLIFVIASGRVRYESMTVGLALGVSVGVLSGLTGFPQSTGYEGRLSGLFGDPNLAGLVLITYGLVALSFLPMGKWKTCFMLLTAVGLFATYSRTSWLGMVIGILWFVLASRVRLIFSIPLVVIAAWLGTTLSAGVQSWGPFALRDGSDELRVRIIEEELILIGQSPWLGHGAGNTRVDVSGGSFFFHNSYLGLQIEFGLIGLIILMSICAIIFWKLVRHAPWHRSRFLEMAIIGTSICAFSLGEVWLALETAIVLGAALRWIHSPPTAVVELRPGAG